jgi:hypothetical protein
VTSIVRERLAFSEDTHARKTPTRQARAGSGARASMKPSPKHGAVVRPAPGDGAHCGGGPPQANSCVLASRSVSCARVSMSAIRPFVRALSTHRRSADLTGVGSVRRRLVGMGEVSDATVSLCALCSGAVAVAAVSLTAADVRRRSALHSFTRTMPHRTVPHPTVPRPAVPPPTVLPPDRRHRLRPSPHLP